MYYQECLSEYQTGTTLIRLLLEAVWSGFALLVYVFFSRQRVFEIFEILSWILKDTNVEEYITTTCWKKENIRVNVLKFWTIFFVQKCRYQGWNSQKTCQNCKQARPWLDCLRSSLIWFFAVCQGISMQTTSVQNFRTFIETGVR